MTLKWFLSRTVRQASHAARHVRKLVEHQRDLLSKEAIDAVTKEINDVETTTRTGSTAQIRESVAQLEKAANKWLKPYPNAAWRENVEVLLVAIAVAMGIRTFFLQPFKIPTGSMQPTLYGVTDENLIGRTDFKIPNPVAGFFEYWFRGVSYKRVVAAQPGVLEEYKPPSRFILFNLKQTLRVGAKTYTVWFPPDNLLYRAGLTDRFGRTLGREFKTGDDIINLRIISGDHLFVDRVTYNFRRPNRGDIVVFETHGLDRLPPDQQNTYYIKRLIGLGGETIALRPDYELVNVPEHGSAHIPVGHLVVNGKDITGATAPFENLYAFLHADRATKTLQYRENHYHGHALMNELGFGREFMVRPKHYFVMGDNTMNSSDSRYWGDFPQDRVIGKSFFVYWPIGSTAFKGEQRQSRFGWSHR